MVDLGTHQAGEVVPIRCTLDGEPATLTGTIKPPGASAVSFEVGSDVDPDDSEWEDLGSNVYQLNYIAETAGRYAGRIYLASSSKPRVVHVTFHVERDPTA